MKDLSPLRKDWKNEIASGHIQQALKGIIDTINSSSHKYNEVLNLKARYNDLMRDNGAGIIENEYFYQESNKLRKSLMNFIDQIPEEDITEKEKKLIETQSDIFTNPIAIFSDPEGVIMLKSYFINEGFTKIQTLPWEDFDKDVLSKTDLVLFNDIDLPEPNKDEQTSEKAKLRSEIMEKAITQTKCFFVYYGLFHPLVKKHVYRITAANSIFTLLGRVKEMVRFIDKYS